MTEREIRIVVEDDFGRVMTSIKTELSPPKLMDKILGLFDENEQLKADEKLYAKEILRLKEELKEKEMLKLGGDY